MLVDVSVFIMRGMKDLSTTPRECEEKSCQRNEIVEKEKRERADDAAATNLN